MHKVSLEKGKRLKFNANLPLNWFDEIFFVKSHLSIIYLEFKTVLMKKYEEATKDEV